MSETREQPGAPPAPAAGTGGAGGTDLLHRDVAFAMRRTDGVYLAAVAATGMLGLGAVVALAVKAAGGAEPYAKWGYPAAAAAFVLSTAQAAPFITFATRLVRGQWSVPFRRLADLCSLSGLVTAPVLVLLALNLPDFTGRPSIWHDWPGSPWLYDSIAAVGLALTGLVAFLAQCVPDLAALRDAREGAGTTTSRWRGTGQQWRALRQGTGVLSGFAAMLFVFVNLLVTSDMAMSLVPGYASADLPGWHAVSALEGGMAVCLLAAWLLRRSRPYGEHVWKESFHSGGKLLLALGLLWFYLFWAEFLTYWYGAMPEEQKLIELFDVGPYRWLFYGAFGLTFLAPLLLLIWNPIRRSVNGPALAAALVLVGLLCDRMRLYVGAWSVAGPVTERLETLPATHFPDVWDALVLVGLPAAAVCLVLLALRVVPPISLWELREMRRLRSERPFLKIRVPVLARPA